MGKLKPEVLRPGEVIGIVAPAGAIEAAQVTAGVRVLEQAGYRIRLGDSVFKRVGYLAGNDRDRAADLAAMFADDEVRAILAARGGYGSGRLLSHIDIEQIRGHPKIFVGYSDLTFLLTMLVQRVGLVAFHGPMVSGFATAPDGAKTLLSMLGGDRSSWNMKATHIVQPGTSEGVIVGGCLSVVVATLATPYEIETAGRILFLEDVGEKPYRVDRMLTQLRQAGKLDELAGVVFGEMSGCVADPNEAVSVRDVIEHAFADSGYPVVFGLPSGHGYGGATLPLGVRVRLAGERLTLLESPVAL